MEGFWVFFFNGVSIEAKAAAEKRQESAAIPPLASLYSFSKRTMETQETRKRGLVLFPRAIRGEKRTKTAWLD